mmetsp:Transcript_15894/g.32982  ORF Transcript_15894/g.32982 Transcript_15894/m.32982 type:complete len:114 (-) Transcript_15894:419-760(-)
MAARKGGIIAVKTVDSTSLSRDSPTPTGGRNSNSGVLRWGLLKCLPFLARHFSKRYYNNNANQFLPLIGYKVKDASLFKSLRIRESLQLSSLSLSLPSPSNLFLLLQHNSNNN